jgi:hypothetical protein
MIIPIYVFAAVFITLFILYITAPAPKIIVKLPSVDDEESSLYIDDNNVCYKYKREEVKCQLNRPNKQKS